MKQITFAKVFGVYLSLAESFIIFFSIESPLSLRKISRVKVEFLVNFDS